MFLTGFADEASESIDGQIQATNRLNWHCIESRCIDKVNIHNLSDEKFEEVCGKLADAEIRVNCFGSTIANWQHEPLDDAGFEATKADLARALVRMKKLHCPMIRGMSFHFQLDRPAWDEEIERWVFPRVAELVHMCEDAGVIYGHENCMNYAGQSYRHTLKLLDAVKSPAFRLIFDTGNPVFNFDRSHGDALETYQNSRQFYDNVREFISHVHIKDAVMKPDENGKMAPVYCFAGDGDGCVREIVTDLLRNGYDGGFSMEPHMVKVFHNTDENAPEDDTRSADNYVEYGSRFEKLLHDVQKSLGK